jgi:hypothetical protein
VTAASYQFQRAGDRPDEPRPTEHPGLPELIPPGPRGAPYARP